MNPVSFSSLNDLRGKRVVYQRSVKMLEVVLEPYESSCNIVTVGSSLEALAMVLEGKADVAMAVSFENFLIGKHGRCLLFKEQFQNLDR